MNDKNVESRKNVDEDEFMEIKLLDSIDYEVVGKLLHDSYLPQWGEAGSPEWSPKYVEYLDKAYIQPGNGFYVGGFEGSALIGIGVCFLHEWVVSEIGSVPVMCLCNCGVLPEHQKKGIATAIVEKLEKAAKDKGVKLSYRVCNKSLNDHVALSKVGYIKKLENAFQCARIMGSEMIGKTAQLKGYGRALKLLLKAVAGFPKEKNKVQYGTVREGTEADITACVKLLNAYKDSASISRTWTENEFHSVIGNKDILDGTPFKVFFYVWDVDGEIKAVAVGRYEKIMYSTGTGLPAIIIHTGLASDLLRKDKTSFAVSVLYELKANGSETETFATNLAVAHHEEKAYDKAGFNNDRSTRPLYVKALSDELNEWLQAEWKYKNYLIPYQR